MTITAKSLLGSLLVSFFVFVLFVPVFQTKAGTTAGSGCKSSSECTGTDGPYSCKSITDKSETPFEIEGGVCGGPCTIDADCDGIKSALKWGGKKCTGTPAVAGVPAGPGVPTAVPAKAAANGVCLELPSPASSLSDTALVTSGLELLNLVNTVTNWVFAIFFVLSIIFVLLAAFQFVTAGGQAEKVGEARQKLIWAAVGIVIALFSKTLVPVIRSIVGG